MRIDRLLQREHLVQVGHRHRRVGELRAIAALRSCGGLGGVDHLALGAGVGDLVAQVERLRLGRRHARAPAAQFDAPAARSARACGMMCGQRAGRARLARQMRRDRRKSRCRRRPALRRPAPAPHPPARTAPAATTVCQPPSSGTGPSRLRPCARRARPGCRWRRLRWRQASAIASSVTSRHHRQVGAEGQALGDAAGGAHAGERAGAGAEGDRVALAERHAGFGQQFLHHRQDRLGMRAHAGRLARQHRAVLAAARRTPVRTRFQWRE